MTHIARTLKMIVLIVVAAAPAVAIDPAVRSFITHHPGVAAYLPPAAGIFFAVYRAWRDLKPTPAPSPTTPAAAPPPGRA